MRAGSLTPAQLLLLTVQPPPVTALAAAQASTHRSPRCCCFCCCCACFCRSCCCCPGLCCCPGFRCCCCCFCSRWLGGAPTWRLLWVYAEGLWFGSAAAFQAGLREQGALDANGEITRLGYLMMQLPIDVRLCKCVHGVFALTYSSIHKNVYACK